PSSDPPARETILSEIAGARARDATDACALLAGRRELLGEERLRRARHRELRLRALRLRPTDQNQNGGGDREPRDDAERDANDDAAPPRAHARLAERDPSRDDPLVVTFVQLARRVRERDRARELGLGRRLARILERIAQARRRGELLLGRRRVRIVDDR